MTFLREQTCLLVRILRRSHGGKCKDDGNTGNAATEDTVAMEVVQLRQEQRAIEEQVVAMWRRVQENQMLMFLAIISNL
jgi:heat shock transcription factor, other eukaryote